MFFQALLAESAQQSKEMANSVEEGLMYLNGEVKKESIARHKVVKGAKGAAKGFGEEMGKDTAKEIGEAARDECCVIM